MDFYRLYYVDRDGRKLYVCYVPTYQLGLHFCADPDRCVMYGNFEKAQESANWYTNRCGNVEGECQVERYVENRSVSRNRWKDGDFLLTELVPHYERRDWIDCLPA